MSGSSDFNMLRLEAPRELAQITDGTPQMEGAVEIANPAAWVRTLARQQRQAEEDMQRLIEACGDTVDRTDQRIQRVERAYHDLTEGTRYVYDRMSANEEVAEAWIRSELAVAANAYQTFAQNVWAAIIERTNEAAQQQIGQATQLARINDALAFQTEANIARNDHLVTFQGNVEKWAAEHQARVAYLEDQLRKTQEGLRKVATMVPTPASPPVAWRSPAHPPSTSIPGSQPPNPTLGSPFRPCQNPGTQIPIHPDRQRRNPLLLPSTPPQRRQRPPAIPATPATLRGPLAPGAGGPPSGPPTSPSIPPLPPSPTPPQHRRRWSPPSQPRLTPQELVQLVAEGVARAHQYQDQGSERVYTSRLKMKNPDNFDGKTTTAFNQWWEAVTMYLGFYPETNDRQKIAWVGTLLSDTALVWHLQRYRELGDNDTWVHYVAAIKAEYHNEREGADAQAKLGQLKYQGSIRAYMTEFRALNNFARATGEGLREKVDLAMTDAILDMRFNQNPEEPVDDELFLHATYRAGIQVEKKKALKGARELVRGAQPSRDDRKKDERRGKNPASGQNDREAPEPRKKENEGETEKGRERWYGQKTSWATKDAALKGVPAAECEEYGRSREDCWRCGRNGHKTYECYAGTTAKGTALPKALWKVSAVAPGKRKRTEEPDAPPAKQQKVAAVETMDTDTVVPFWEDSELDF